MKKNITTIVIAVLILAQTHMMTVEAANPLLRVAVDCDSSEKNTLIGVTTDPANPANGKEIIAFRFVFELTPTGGTTLQELETAKLEKNPALQNLLIAESKTEKVGNLIRVTGAGGFTEQNGVRNEDLFILKGTNQKNYRLTVNSGELYEENNLQNFFVNQPVLQTVVNPGTECTPTTPPATPATPSTPGSTPAPASPQTPGSGQIGQAAPQGTVAQIELSTTPDTPSYKPGDSIVVSALISSRNNRTISWSQVAGTQISPTTQDTEQPDGKTKSDLTFTIPTSIRRNETIILSVTVGVGSDASTETVNLLVEPIAVETLRGSADGVTGVQERIETIRQNTSAQIPSLPVETAGNIHNAGGLAGSGPGETMTLVMVSLGIYTLYRKMRSSYSSRLS